MIRDIELLTAAAAPGAGNYRWVVCALLFFATTINYIDRQILALLKPIERDLETYARRLVWEPQEAPDAFAQAIADLAAA